MLLSEDETRKQTSIDVKGLNSVVCKSENKIINTGDKACQKETGLLSIWMLGMFNPSPSVIIVIPVKKGDENLLRPKVNDNYFGEISGERLKVSGDALNSYNDEPLEDGSQMGPFYELETSSPAAELKPGESLSHIQFTLHLTGNPEYIDKISRKVLGVSLEEIKNAF